MAEKIILFGGTFDPVHTGHIEVAQAAAKNIKKRIRFIRATPLNLYPIGVSS